MCVDGLEDSSLPEDSVPVIFILLRANWSFANAGLGLLLTVAFFLRKRVHARKSLNPFNFSLTNN